jgi:hypothetical protein
MSASAGILRTELHFESRGSGAAPRLDGAEPRPHTNKLKTIETRPGQPVTSLSKLDHSADRLEWWIISKGRCHNPATSG